MRGGRLWGGWGIWLRVRVGGVVWRWGLDGQGCIALRCQVVVPASMAAGLVDVAVRVQRTGPVSGSLQLSRL